MVWRFNHATPLPPLGRKAGEGREKKLIEIGKTNLLKGKWDCKEIIINNKSNKNKNKQEKKESQFESLSTGPLCCSQKKKKALPCNLELEIVWRFLGKVVHFSVFSTWSVRDHVRLLENWDGQLCSALCMQQLVAWRRVCNYYFGCTIPVFPL